MPTKHKTTKRKSKATSQSAKRTPLTEEKIRRIVDKMPGGLPAFATHWGWLDFARKLEHAHRIR